MGLRKGPNMSLADAQAHADKHGYQLEPFRKQFGDQAAIATMEKDAKKKMRQTRQMNKTETEFARILEAKKQRGEITDYKFEGIRLRWGESMWYKPDFVARGANGVTYLYEVKGGHIWSRDLVRFKGCRAEWRPYKNFEFEMWQKKAGQWTQLQ
jgi:hypothetical protein